MKTDFCYMYINDDSWDCAERTTELLEKLKDGWKILSAVGTSGRAHYILTKSNKLKKEKK